MQKTLILGLGNDILCDDGIGMRLAKDLEKAAAHPPGSGLTQRPQRGQGLTPAFGGGAAVFSFLPASIDGFSLVDAMAGFDKVFILDAFQTRDLEVGEVAVLGMEDLEHTIYIGSPHSVNLASAVKICGKQARMFPSYKLPEEIIIIAVNVYDAQTFSENLSPQLQEKYPRILNKVKEIINL